MRLVTGDWIIRNFELTIKILLYCYRKPNTILSNLFATYGKYSLNGSIILYFDVEDFFYTAVFYEAAII